MVVINEKGFDIENNHVLGKEDYYSWLVRIQKEQGIVLHMHSLEYA
jgi:hypothetical protein